MQSRRDPRAAAAGPSAFAARRRAAALERQRAAREGAVDAARAVRAERWQEEEATASASAAAQPMVADAPRRSPRPPSSSSRGWRALTLHEWLVDVPARLAADWVVAPRPEGARVVLTARGGRTQAHSRAGALLHTFPSHLPGGGGGGGSSGGAGCVLDCVFQADPPAPAPASASSLGGTFFALDVLAWGGRDLEPCTAEFRVFWLASRLAECGAAEAAPPGGARVAPLLYAPATAPALLAAARSPPPPYARDGLLLLHKEGGYEAGAPNPLALVWKDSGCAPRVLDTDPAAGGPAPSLTAVLRVGQDGVTLVTGDDPPVSVGRAAGAEAPPPSPGRLVRVVAPGGVAVDPATGAAAAPGGLTLAPGPPPRGRAGRADTLSKLLFQSAARAGGGVPLDALTAAAAEGGGDVEDMR